MLNATTWLKIDEEIKAVGDNLFFPAVSTCAAIVLRYDNELVGFHKSKTAGYSNRATKIIATLKDGPAPNALYIIGWCVGKGPVSDQIFHDIDAIKADFCPNVGVAKYHNFGKPKKETTKVLSTGSAHNLAIFVQRRMGNLDPDFYLKNNAKVTSSSTTKAEFMQAPSVVVVRTGQDPNLVGNYISPSKFKSF